MAAGTARKTTLFATITVLIFLVVSDIALRLLIPSPPSRPFEWPPPDKTRHGMMADKTLFWKLKPGYNGPWGIYKLAYTHELAQKKPIDWEARKQMVAPAYKGVTWQVNQEGFRGSMVSREKQPGTIRLLFLGTSITFGWGVKAEQAFPEIVRKELAKAYPEITIETVNAGVPGYSSYQGLQYLKRRLPAYRPDIVLAEFGINDGTMAVGKGDKDWQPRFSHKIRLELRSSGWGRLVLRVFQPLIKKPAIVDVWQTWDQAKGTFYRISMTGTMTRVDPSDFEANLEKMASLCQKNEALFFVYIPSLYNEYGKKRLIRSVNFTPSNAVPIHQTLLAYPAETIESFLLPFDEAHLSVAGHKVVGDSVAAFAAARLSALQGRSPHY